MDKRIFFTRIDFAFLFYCKTGKQDFMLHNIQNILLILKFKAYEKGGKQILLSNILWISSFRNSSLSQQKWQEVLHMPSIVLVMI